MLNLSQNNFRQKRNVFVLLGIIVLNFVIKFIYVDYPDIGGDEPFSIFYANADLKTYFEIIHTENNPPLYLFLLKGWIKLFGMTPLSVRMMSVIFSSLTAGVIFQLGKRYFSFKVGLLTALLFTFTTYHMEFAHQARVYALFGLLTMTSMYSYLRLVIDNQKRHAILLVLYNILLIYAHFFGFFVVLIQFASALFIKDIRTGKFKELFIGWIITGLAYIPFISITLGRFTDSASETWQSTVKITDLYNNLWNFSNQPFNTVIFLLILIGGLFTFLIRTHKEALKTQYKVVAIWFLVPYFLMFFISFYIPMFLYRYLVFLSFGYYFLIAISLETIIRKALFFYIISILLVVMMSFTCNFKVGNSRPDKIIVDKIKESKGENTSVVVCPKWHFLLFSYHYDIDMFKDYSHIFSRLEKEKVYPVYKLSDEIKEQINKSDTIIFLDAWASLTDPEMSLKSYLDNNFNLIREPDVYDGTTVSYYCQK